MAQVTLSPTKDAYTQSGSGGSNYGTATGLYIGRDGNPYNYYGYLQFDLSSIPSGATITSAILKMTMTYNYNASQSQGFDIRACTSPWAENTITWNTNPQYDSSIVYGTFTIPINLTAITAYEMDIKALAVKWLNGTLANNGIFIQYQNGLANSWKEFGAREHPTAAYRPTLTITYNVAPNAPVINNPKGTSASPAIINTTTPTLDWSFSDNDAGDTQSKYKLRVLKDSDSSVVHDTGEVTSSLTDYTIPVGIIQKNTVYRWYVYTWDAAGVQSAASSPEYFQLLDQANVGDVFTFNYTGAEQDFIVPGNVRKLKLEVIGATGGRNTSSSAGGAGGYAKGEYVPTPGQTLKVRVGGKGGDTPNNIGGVGGYNGGGAGGTASSSYTYGAGGGGGASDIRAGGNSAANRIIVAGGGGGATLGSTWVGGKGGGTDGTSGSGGGGATVGTGGSQTSGGIGYVNGSLDSGGSGQTATSANSGGGGGGGGYFGGGGGYINAGGGGGSGYVGTLTNTSMTTGHNSNGNGQVMITVLEVSTPPTVINRDPGNSDQLNPEGGGLTPLFSWDFGGTFTQTKYQIKIFNTDNTVAHDTGLVTSSAKQYQLAAGILQGGRTYGWELTVVDNNNVSYPTSRLYFITNNLPLSPTPINPIDTKRTGKRPEFEATIGNDIEDDRQKFIIQIADDSNFSTGLQERNLETSQTGWQAKAASNLPYENLTSSGVDSSFEGGVVKYTWQDDLTEGKTYYWRMAAIDGTTGARGLWSSTKSIRVGDKLSFKLKAPIETTAHAKNILLTIQSVIPTDGNNPSSISVLVCNNGYDEEPTWEDMTQAYKSGNIYEFINDVKTNEKWGIDIKITIQANDSLGPIEIDGFGFSFN